MAFFPREGYRFVFLHVLLSVGTFFLLRRLLPELGEYVWVAAPCASGLMLTGLDKLAAQAGVRRVPETALYAIAFLGGSLGVLLGMHLFRHKTRKPSFQFALALVFLAQLAILTTAFRR